MEIKVVTGQISKQELAKIASEGFGDIVKAVVDIAQEIMAVGGELHADEEALLIGERESKGEHLWGINLYPHKFGEEWIEFDSMINLKPAHGNRSRGVEDIEVRGKIIAIVKELISN